MKPQDILADIVHISRPKVLILLMRILDASHIIEQCIKPDIDNVGFINRQWYTPGKAFSGYAQVSQRFLQSVDDFIPAKIWLDKFWMRPDMCYERLLILAHPKEVALLLNLLHRSHVDRAVIVR